MGDNSSMMDGIFSKILH